MKSMACKVVYHDDGGAISCYSALVIDGVELPPVFIGSIFANCRTKDNANFKRWMEVMEDMIKQAVTTTAKNNGVGVTFGPMIDQADLN